MTEYTLSSCPSVILSSLCHRHIERTIALSPVPTLAARYERLKDFRNTVDVGLTGFLSWPGTEHGRGVTADHDYPFAVAAQLTCGMDKRLTKEQRGARRRNHLVNERWVFIGAGDDLRLRRFHLVAPGNDNRAAVIRAKVSEVGQGLDKVAMIQAILDVGAKFWARAGVEAVAARRVGVVIRRTRVDNALRFFQAHRAA